MSLPQLVRLLEEIGLTEGEAKTYFAALSLGSTTVLKMSQVTGIKRTSLYPLIASLKKRGLMIIETRGFKKRYAAADPKLLETTLDAKREKLHQHLPKLSDLYHTRGDETSIKHYEGIHSVRLVYEMLFKGITKEGYYYVMSDFDRWLASDPEYLQAFVERRARLSRIITQLVFLNSPLAQEHKKLQRNYREEIRFISPTIKLTADVIVTPKRVVLHQLFPSVAAIVIENHSVIQAHKASFELIWQNASAP